MIKEIEKEFKSQFPNGWIRFGKTCLGGNEDTFRFGLVDPNELTSKILMNDPVYHSFIIFNDSKGFSAEGGGCISVNPVEKFYAMSSVKTKWRKTRGNEERVLKAFKTFFGRLRVLVDENESNIYQRDKYSDKWFK